MDREISMTFQQARVKKLAMSMASGRDMSTGPVSPAILGWIGRERERERGSFAMKEKGVRFAGRVEIDNSSKVIWWTEPAVNA